MNKPKAAAIYFNEALKYGSPEVSAQARTLLAELAAADPEALASAQKGQPDQDYTVSSAKNLKNSDDYIGPMAPELARLGQKPSMRAGNDNFLPVPLSEPVLPTKPGAASSDGTLLPPVPATEKPALLPNAPSGTLLPVPALPARPTGELPVPPKPSAP
jgi:hypothetical protein